MEQVIERVERKPRRRGNLTYVVAMIPEQMVTKLDALADQNMTSRASIIRQACAKLLATTEETAAPSGRS